MDGHSFRSYQRASSQGGAAADRATAPTLPPPLDLLRACGNLEIRPEEIQVLADGRRVGFTVREFEVFMVLAERADRVVRRAEIYDRVWGGEMKRRDRSVDVFVRKVRTKLARVSPDWSYIHTHFGIGYRFAAVPPAPADPLAPAGQSSGEPQAAHERELPRAASV